MFAFLCLSPIKSGPWSQNNEFKMALNSAKIDKFKWKCQQTLLYVSSMCRDFSNWIGYFTANKVNWCLVPLLHSVPNTAVNYYRRCQAKDISKSLRCVCKKVKCIAYIYRSVIAIDIKRNHWNWHISKQWYNLWEKYERLRTKSILRFLTPHRTCRTKEEKNLCTLWKKRKCKSVARHAKSTFIHCESGFWAKW